MKTLFSGDRAYDRGIFSFQNEFLRHKRHSWWRETQCFGDILLCFCCLAQWKRLSKLCFCSHQGDGFVEQLDCSVQVPPEAKERQNSTDSYYVQVALTSCKHSDKQNHLPYAADYATNKKNQPGSRIVFSLRYSNNHNSLELVPKKLKITLLRFTKSCELVVHRHLFQSTSQSHTFM